MRPTRVWIAFCCCVLALAAFAWAQSRRPGLYEVTTEMTWQQSPLPAGMNGGPMHGPHTSQVCVSQEQIDKYNGVPPQTRGDCQVTNMAKRPDGYTADISCTGQMTAKGTVDAAYTEDGHGKTKIHMIGTMQMGPNSKPVEYTLTSDSTYKGADCGSVKPVDSK
jgi:hypothetical protein